MTVLRYSATLGATAVAALLVAAAVWLVVQWLSLIWEQGLPDAVLTGVYVIRIVVFFGMMVALFVGARATIRALTSHNRIIETKKALFYYGLIVLYSAFGMSIPIPGIGFLEPLVYLGIALLLLLVVKVRTLASNKATQVDSYAVGLSSIDPRHARVLTIFATAAVLGASGAYAWLVLQGGVADCFVRECADQGVVGVVSAMAIAGTLTAVIVLWSFRTRGRVTTLGIIATTFYGCLALVGLALPVSTLMPYDFFAPAFWYALAGLAFLICQSRFEDDSWPSSSHVM